MLAQQIGAHGRALDVPAGTAGAPGGFPGGLACLGVLPQHEVQGVLLGRIHFHPFTGPQVVQGLAGEAAVAGELAHREIHVAVGGLVGQAVGFQLADEAQHLGHVLGGPGFVGGLLHAQGGGILIHGRDEAVGQLADGLAVFHGPTDDLVVDVGDVADVGHVQTAGPQPAIDGIEYHQHPGVAQVAEIVNRHAADIHFHLAGFNGDEFLLFPGDGVIDFQHGQKEKWGLSDGQKKGRELTRPTTGLDTSGNCRGTRGADGAEIHQVDGPATSLRRPSLLESGSFAKSPKKAVRRSLRYMQNTVKSSERV